jgi:Rieske Fe-S protein
MERRSFLKIMAAGATIVAVNPSLIGGTLYADDGRLFKAYEKAQIVDASGVPIKVSLLEKEVTYIFNYQFNSTPCMLINLSEPTQQEITLKSEMGEEYVWKSGVGNKRTIVAYSAICAHQLTHPTKNDSFIKYVPKGTPTMAYEKSGIIVCSSHLSAYDAGAGAKVLAGAALQPLAAVVLEIAADDTIWAVGVLGSDKFQEYFRAFKPEFREFYGGVAEAKTLVSISAKTVNLTEYSKEIIQY